MTVYNRLLLELSNREYFSESEYNQLLKENGLTGTDTYDKATMQRKLLLTILDILRMLCNDTDNLQKLADGETGFTTSQLYSQLEKRIAKVEKQIAEIPLDATEQYSDVYMLFTRKRC